MHSLLNIDMPSTHRRVDAYSRNVLLLFSVEKIRTYKYSIFLVDAKN